MKQTLLDKARAVLHVPTWGIDVSDESIDLALAVINGDIGAKQACVALGKNHTASACQHCYSVLRQAIRLGKVARIERISGNGKR